MKEYFIIKAIVETKISNCIKNEMIIAERETEDFPSDEQIEEMKKEFHADRCEVAKCYK